MNMSNDSSHIDNDSIDIDWQLCVICQQTTREPLQCPANLKPGHPGYGKGYVSFCDNIDKFIHSGVCLPVPLKLKLLKGETSIADTLAKNKCKWHKTCRIKFNDREHDRATKRLQNPSGSVCSDATPIKVTRKSTANATSLDKDICFICNKCDMSTLHKVSTFEVDERVRRCAHILQDTILISKLAPGDLISQDAVYHRSCLTNLYRRADKEQQVDSESDSEREAHGIALAELIEFISESHQQNVTVFKLSDLLKLYKERIVQLGIPLSTRVQSTRLKARIMSYFRDMHAYNEGRDVFLAFKDDVGFALKHIEEFIDYDNDAVVLCKAANIVRRDMFNSKNCTFNGTFQETCQQKATPKFLQTIVEMILEGSNIKTRTSKVVEFQSALSIAQLMMFNSTYIRRRNTSNSVYNSKQREPPLPIYVGLTVHAETKKRGLVDKLHDLGLSISYHRVLEISTAVGNSVCQTYHDQGVVCPPNLQSGHFITAAVDNIDHNPSSTTAQGAQHGTAISLFQHGSHEVDDSTAPSTHYCDTSDLTLKPLPYSYVNVPPLSMWNADPSLPEMMCDISLSDTVFLEAAMDIEDRWLKNVHSANCTRSEDAVQTTEALPWSVFHAIHSSDVRADGIDKKAMLPIFQDEAKSAAMIRHSIDIIKDAVNNLNPDQTPVIACDQPLYAIAKQIQWNWPLTYGEDKVVIMFGGLHIEMAAWKTIGDWLENSGWTAALVQSNIATAGKADSFLKSSHVSRTRHVHEVTVCSLYILQHRAYSQYLEVVMESSAGESVLDFKQWITKRTNECPQFQYWHITITLELTILLFVRSIREGNHRLYVQALNQLIPWFFALDHINYSRWLPVHLRDMASLPEKNPDVYHAFLAGKFVIHKTHRYFSGIAIDHAHEQNNRCVKEDGGAIGLTENSSQLLRWMISGPEIARITSEFEISHERVRQEHVITPDTRHHQEAKSHHKRFITQVNNLVETIDEMGNPFLESSEDMLQLDTRDIADKKVVETVREIERIGQEQFRVFIQDRLEMRTTSLLHPIKKNKFSLFRCQSSSSSKPSAYKQTITSLKKSCSLFSQLYVSCQVRNGDLDDFFRHENQSFPPALSTFGNLQSGTKSDLLSVLESLSDTATPLETPITDAVLLDGAAIVNMLKPGRATTFLEYSSFVFKPYVMSQLHNTKRVDIIWDVYLQDSLKATTRDRRGNGVRRRVLPDTKLPGNWQAFLRTDDNKIELFQFLSKEAVEIDPEIGCVVATNGDQVLCNIPDYNLTVLTPCNHEEADTRLILHAHDCVNKNMTKLMIRTVDTDVVVLAIAFFYRLSVHELWIAFGVGKKYRYISIHDIATHLGDRKSEALAGFHAFTGCDQTSFFCGKGKKTAFNVYNSFDASIDIFHRISTTVFQDDLPSIQPIIERFVVLLYDRTSANESVNATRLELFAQKGRQIDNIPPTSAALTQHIKRVIFQAGYIWGQAMVVEQEIPSPTHWGWTWSSDHHWQPVWSTLPEAAKSCSELIRCFCKVERGCSGRCKCMKANLKCTALCKCSGDCEQ